MVSGDGFRRCGTVLDGHSRLVWQKHLRVATGRSHRLWIVEPFERNCYLTGRMIRIRKSNKAPGGVKCTLDNSKMMTRMLSCAPIPFG